MDNINEYNKQTYKYNYNYNNIKITSKITSLISRLQNHINNKIKLSFIPNEYYNDKIYILINYDVKKGNFGQNLNLVLKDDTGVINYTIENIIDLEEKEYFNRIEYTAKVRNIKDTYYNFCIYY